MKRSWSATSGTGIQAKFKMAEVNKKQKVAYKKKNNFIQNATLDKMLKEKMKKIVQDQEEKKFDVATFTLQPQCIQATTAAINGNICVLTPSTSAFGWNITQGTENYNRVGNRTKMKSHKLGYIITQQPYNATSNPVPQPSLVTFYIVKSKLTPDGQITVGHLKNDWYFINDSTGMTGYPIDHIQVVDHDNFTVLKQMTFKVGAEYNGVTGFDANNQNWSNNDFQRCVMGEIDLTPYSPVTTKWDSDNNVNSTWLQLIIQVTSCQVGDLYTVDTELPVAIQLVNKYCYTDA